MGTWLLSCFAEENWSLRAPSQKQYTLWSLLGTKYVSCLQKIEQSSSVHWGACSQGKAASPGHVGPLHCLLSIFRPLHCLDWVVHVLERNLDATWPHCAGHGVHSDHWPHTPSVSGFLPNSQKVGVELGFHYVQKWVRLWSPFLLLATIINFFSHCFHQLWSIGEDGEKVTVPKVHSNLTSWAKEADCVIWAVLSFWLFWIDAPEPNSGFSVYTLSGSVSWNPVCSTSFQCLWGLAHTSSVIEPNRIQLLVISLPSRVIDVEPSRPLVVIWTDRDSQL